MAELWRALTGYEDSYEVSDLGRARSKDRIRIRRNGSPIRIKGRILKSSKDPLSGYLRVNLRDGRSSLTRRVHSLVLEAFIGPRPPEKEACHFDGDKENNALSNLRYDTRGGNVLDAVRHGTAHMGEAHHASKLTEASIRTIRKMYKRGRVTFKDIAELFGVSPHCIGHVVRRQTWKHVD